MSNVAGWIRDNMCCVSPFSKRILIIPAPSQTAGVEEDYKKLLRIGWDAVFDFGNEETSILYRLYKDNACSHANRGLTVWDNASAFDGTQGIAQRPGVNWVFARGMKGKGTYEPHRWKAKFQSPLADFTRSLFAAGPTSEDYQILCLNDDIETFLERICEEAVIGPQPSAANLLCINTQGKYDNLSETLEGYGVTPNIIPAGISSILDYLPLECFEETLGLEDTTKPSEDSLFTGGEKDNYRQAGIVFYDDVPNAFPENYVSRYHHGARITKADINSGMIVQRRGLEMAIDQIKKKITSNNTDRFTIFHAPGCGGSTFLLQIADRISRLAADHMLPSLGTIVLLNAAEDRAKTAELLNEISTRIDNDKLVILADQNAVGDVQKIEYLKNRFAQSHRNVLIVDTSRILRQNSGTPGGFRLSPSVRPDELQNFVAVYTSPLVARTPEEREHVRKLECVKPDIVDFPLALNEIEPGLLRSYIEPHYYTIGKENKPSAEFCKYASLIYHYTGNAVNPALFGVTDELKNLSENAGASFRSLMEMETKAGQGPTGYYRPRISQFAEAILEIVTSKNWIANVGQMLVQFLESISNRTVGNADMGLINTLFLQRNDGDTFAPVIEDLREKNDDSSCRAIFEALTVAFPEDAHFLGHYARYLYENAAKDHMLSPIDKMFIDASQKMERAISLEDEDAELWHMRGMLYYRRLGALQRQYKDSEKKDNNQYEDDMISMAAKARDSFLRSRQLDSSDPHTHAGLGQLASLVIGQGIKINAWERGLDAEDIEIYTDYFSDLGEAVESLNTYLSMLRQEDSQKKDTKKTNDIYLKLRTDYMGLLGDFDSAINKFAHARAESEDATRRIKYGLWQVRCILQKIAYENNLNINEAFGHLDRPSLESVSEVLHDNMSHGDLPSFNYYITLQRHLGRDAEPVDRACLDIEKWLMAAKDANDDESLMWAYYYKGLVHAMQALASESPDRANARDARDAFVEARRLAKNQHKFMTELHDIGKFPKGRTPLMSSICDLHKLTGPRMLVCGRVIAIEKPGKVQLSNGLIVSFSPKKYLTSQDINKTELCGFIVARLDGIGLYDFFRKGSQLDYDTYERLSICDKIEYRRQQELWGQAPIPSPNKDNPTKLVREERLEEKSPTTIPVAGPQTSEVKQPAMHIADKNTDSVQPQDAGACYVDDYTIEDCLGTYDEKNKRFISEDVPQEYMGRRLFSYYWQPLKSTLYSKNVILEDGEKYVFDAKKEKGKWFPTNIDYPKSNN